MENVMTNGFENLNADELENVDGGLKVHVGTDGIWVEGDFSYKRDVYNPMYKFGENVYDFFH